MPNNNRKPKAPRVFLKLTRDHPEVFAAIDQLGAAVRSAGPLDTRTSHLIQLAAAAAARSEQSTDNYRRHRPHNFPTRIITVYGDW